MIQQLRIYEIFEKNKAQFHARFRDHAARIMQTRYGFAIVAMWETKFGESTEFAYLLEWPDEATKAAAMGGFHGGCRVDRDQARHACRAWLHGGRDRGSHPSAGGLLAVARA